MVPTTGILNTIVDLLAADTATIAPAALALHVHLVKTPFTPIATLLIGDVTPATFDGSTPLNAGVGPQDVFRDPQTTLRIVQILEPAGGWHWDVTGVTDLPQTIYGYVVTDNADADIYGAALLSTPLTLSSVGQGIDLSWIRFTFLAGSPV